MTQLKSDENLDSGKPMFDSEEIIGIKSQDFRSDEAIKLKKEIDTMHQVIHQKGLEVGEPGRLMEDISDAISYLNKLSTLIDEGKWKKKIDEEEVEIIKYVNKGQVELAYHKRTLQKQEYERGVHQIIYAIDILVEILKKIQGRLVRK